MDLAGGMGLKAGQSLNNFGCPQMEYVKIPKKEYEKLLRYREIVNHIEEEIHEELNVREVKDKRLLGELKELHGEAKKGKRKTISEKEFLLLFS
jgi:hypothetical protein